MSDVVISARDLGKSYLISHKIDQRMTFRDRIIEGISTLRRNFGRTLRGEQLLAGEEIEEFWALKDVEFEIRRGEAVGIIGRNGAGKSTLLKVLSRITEPTTGRVEIKGRVASLLEVGTGFHPELTGRENILLNGAILGMTRAEIRLRFDEIVDFSGVERFLDTPVKRYSSGMYVRLAFAVAAHLDPEILLIDEVLAVGDAEFQRKCLGKMRDVAAGGRTVLFVSHNMGAVRSLCSSAILLRDGSVVESGAVSDISNLYARQPHNSAEYKNSKGRPSEFFVEAASIRASGSDIEIHIRLNSGQLRFISIDVLVRDVNGIPLGLASCGGLGSGYFEVDTGVSEHVLNIDARSIATGTYTFGLRIHGAGKVLVANLEDILRLEYNQTALSGYTEAVDQKWGHGSIQFNVHRTTSTTSFGR